MTGSQLGPYKIEAPIGAGGMGEVFRAHDTRLRRTVAIKVLPRERVADLERKRRFLQEARAASALNHPNIVTLHDIADDSGVDYLVMEYVPGKSLDKLIAHKGLPLTDAIGYATQIAGALAAAHAAGIVHRDIKPANVIVTAESQVKVLRTRSEDPGLDGRWNRSAVAARWRRAVLPNGDKMMVVEVQNKAIVYGGPSEIAVGGTLHARDELELRSAGPDLVLI